MRFFSCFRTENAKRCANDVERWKQMQVVTQTTYGHSTQQLGSGLILLQTFRALPRLRDVIMALARSVASFMYTAVLTPIQVRSWECQ